MENQFLNHVRYNPYAIKQLHSRYPKATIKQCNCNELTKQFSANSIPCIISNDVFTTLLTDDLDPIYKESYAVLKPGGYFIQMQIRDAFPSPTIDNYANKNNIIFQGEIINHGVTDIYIIERAEFETALKTLKENDETRLTLERCLKMRPAEREEFLDAILPEKEGLSTRRYILDCVKSLNCPSMKKVNINEAYVSRSTNGLENAGFIVIKNTLLKSRVIAPRTLEQRAYKRDSNFCMNLGVRTTNFIGVLAPGMVQEGANIHVIVARKPLR